MKRKSPGKKNKKIPTRTCSGCRGVFPKSELIRVVRVSNEAAAVDVTGKMNGRGTYICKNSECLEKARKSGGIARSLGIQIPPEIYEKLKAELNDV